MRNCPTSQTSKSKFWGFEVSHIMGAFGVLALSNIVLNALGVPLFLSWFLGLAALAVLRIISSGQKEGHLELFTKFILTPHIYLGHKERSK